jgi:hypothetical protein
MEVWSVFHSAPSCACSWCCLPLCLVSRSPEAQQRVGGCFLSLMPQMRTLYLAYCANHPSAVSVLTEHRFVPWDIGVGGKVNNSASRFCMKYSWYWLNIWFWLTSEWMLVSVFAKGRVLLMSPFCLDFWWKGCRSREVSTSSFEVVGIRFLLRCKAGGQPELGRLQAVPCSQCPENLVCRPIIELETSWNSRAFQPKTKVKHNTECHLLRIWWGLCCFLQVERRNCLAVRSLPSLVTAENWELPLC